MWIYQTIAVGLSKSIVFVCLIITPFGIFLDLKITSAKCRDSGGKPECFGMVLIVLAVHSCVTSCLVFEGNQFLSMPLLWIAQPTFPLKSNNIKVPLYIWGDSSESLITSHVSSRFFVALTGSQAQVLCGKRSRTEARWSKTLRSKISKVSTWPQLKGCGDVGADAYIISIFYV